MNATTQTDRADRSKQPDFDAIVVGAGFAGLYAIYKLRELGFRAQLYERAPALGGTWYWNCYPGARCDAPSMQYSYSFSEELQQAWDWSEYYASQAEILAYLNHVADRFKLHSMMQFNTTVTRAIFDEAAQWWCVTTDKGTATARFCIMATGCLSSSKPPDFPGLESYKGEWYHTSNWPHGGVDFRGKTVGVVGTGSTGIQAIPVIASQAQELYVFQRTAQYSTPARNAAMDKTYEADIKSNYPAYRAQNYRNPVALDLVIDRDAPKTFEVDDAERRATYEQCWAKGGLSFSTAYRDSSLNRAANEDISEFIRQKIATTVDDPNTASLLQPKHIYACKRPCLDTHYYETYNRGNVHLVDVSATGVEKIVPDGLIAAGTRYPLDIIVFATGFDAFTGALSAIDIQGFKGRKLKDKWHSGPSAYLGLMSADFPNFFIVTGPGSPSVLANMVVAIEQHVNFIGACLDRMRECGHTLVKTTELYEKSWLDEVRAAADRTLFTACDNWYQGANIPGKARGFVPYVDWPDYVRTCENVVARDYLGFAFT